MLRTVAGVALALAVVAAPVRAATMVALGDHQLVRLAQAIVLGRAEEIASFVTEDGHRVETSVRFRLEEVLKGPRDLPSVLEIRLPGGETGTLVTQVPGAPRFEPGERAIVFLGPGSDGEARILALSRGKFGIRRDPGTGEDMVVLETEGLLQLETGLGPAASFLMTPSADGRVWLEDFRLALLELIEGDPGK